MPISVNTLGDRVRHHAVDSYRRKQQRENCEKAEQPGAETRLGDGGGHAVFHGADIDERLILIDFIECAAERGSFALRIERGAQDHGNLNHRQKRIDLPIGNNLGLWFVRGRGERRRASDFASTEFGIGRRTDLMRFPSGAIWKNACIV